MALTGRFRIAIVHMMYGYNQKEYGFALYDNDVSIGDIVLVDANNIMQLAKVVNIMTQAAYGKGVTKEVVCKLNIDDYLLRQKIRKRLSKLKADMDKMAKDSQELTLYKMLAENNPEMQKLLNEYTNLQDVL